jgi:hypothetical protein
VNRRGFLGMLAALIPGLSLVARETERVSMVTTRPGDHWVKLNYDGYSFDAPCSVIIETDFDREWNSIAVNDVFTFDANWIERNGLDGYPFMDSAQIAKGAAAWIKERWDDYMDFLSSPDS